MSYFPLVNFVEFVESQKSGAECAENQCLAKSRKLLLKIGPIEVLKFGGAEKSPYLCGVKEQLQSSEMLALRRAVKARNSANLTR